jgi:hypothetical protein
MHKYFLIFLLVLSLFSICYAKDKTEPGAAISQTSFDFGEVKEGSILEHSFNIRNEGSAALDIIDVKPDCGCTTPEFDQVILPGKEGRLTLKLDTSGYTGKIKKDIRVFTSDPDHEMILLHLEANIKSPIIISKDYVALRGSPGEVATDSVDIKALEKTPLKIDVAEYTLGDKVEFNIEQIEKGCHFKLNFKNKPGLSGMFSGQLKLKTNYPDKPEILVKIRGRFVNE